MTVTSTPCPERKIIDDFFHIGARVKLRIWTYLGTVFSSLVINIAAVAYEKSRREIEHGLSERKWLIEQNEVLREKDKVVCVLSELTNTGDLLKTGITGYSKIESETRSVIVVFMRWLVRLIMVEVWSWIP